MTRPTFLPTARETNILLLAGLLSVGYALYIRYTMIENSTVSVACASATTWLCTVRHTTIMLFTYSVFGGVAVAAALVNLIRPHVVPAAIALAAASAGLVLYSAGLSGLAAALLLLSLARPRSGRAAM
jgi:hypothetical protein